MAPRRILMLAWLIAPDRGSEWAASWGMAVAAARLGEVTILARPDCAEAVNRWAKTQPACRIEAVAVTEDETWWTSVGRRVTRGFFLSYLGWLRAAAGTARRLDQERPFDLAVHAALGCYWLPSPVTRLGIPSLWGPVAGATKTPFGLLPVLGAAGLAERCLERGVRAVAGRLPATRRTMREATQVSVESLATLGHLPRDIAARAPVIYRAVLTQTPHLAPRPRGRYLVFPSTLSPGKGGVLAVEALRYLPTDVELLFANTGADEARLRRRVAAYGLGDRARFLGAIPRETCLELVRGAAAALFTGIHEDGGCALCEAMLLGTPIVALGHGGPKEIVERWCTDRSRAILVPPARGPKATGRALGEAVTRLLATAPSRQDPYLDQEQAMEELVGCYRATMRAARAQPVEATAALDPCAI